MTRARRSSCVQAGRTQSSGYRRHGVGLNHIAFTASSLVEIETVAEKVRAAGFEVAAVQSFGADRALFLKDRDGMRIELTAYNAV